MEGPSTQRVEGPFNSIDNRLHVGKCKGCGLTEVGDDTITELICRFHIGFVYLITMGNVLEIKKIFITRI